MAKYYTEAETPVTNKEAKLIDAMHRLSKRWKRDGERLKLFAGPGRLFVVMKGDIPTNQVPESNPDYSFNTENLIEQINIPVEAGEF